MTATLQMRFNTNNGAAGYSSSYNAATVGAGATQFEQAAIGYNNSLGSVRVGRFTNALGVYDFSVFEDSKYGTNASRAAYGRLSATTQLSTPVISGFQAHLIGAQGISNKYGNPGGAAGAGFITGVDYSKQQQGTNPIGVQDFTAIALNYANGPIALQYADIHGVLYEKATRLSASYNTGWAKFYFGQYNQKNDIGLSATVAAVADSTSAAIAAGASGSGLQAHKSTEYGVAVPVGAFTLRAGLQTNDKDLDISKNDGSTKVKKTAWGGEYALSKRTELQYQRMSVKNGVAPTNVALGGATSYGAGFGDSTGSAYFIGIQHKF